MSTIESMYGIRTDVIYTELQIEGVSATYADTEDIILNGRSSNVSQEELNIILGMKHAWEMLFHTAESTPISFEVMSDYNRHIGYGGTFLFPGEIRPSESVHVGDWTPEDVDEETFDQICESVERDYCDIEDIACALVLRLCKAQIFHNGNKRTSQMIANHFLANVDAGFAFCLSDIDARQYFLESLYDYYTGNFDEQLLIDVLRKIALLHFNE